MLDAASDIEGLLLLQLSYSGDPSLTCTGITPGTHPLLLCCSSEQICLSRLLHVAPYGSVFADGALTARPLLGRPAEHLHYV